MLAKVANAGSPGRSLSDSRRNGWTRKSSDQNQDGAGLWTVAQSRFKSVVLLKCVLSGKGLHLNAY